MALVFIAVLGAVNLRGVGGSIKLNVVLSCIEATGLLLVIAVGLWAFSAVGTPTTPGSSRSTPPTTGEQHLRKRLDRILGLLGHVDRVLESDHRKERQ